MPEEDSPLPDYAHLQAHEGRASAALLACIGALLRASVRCAGLPVRRWLDRPIVPLVRVVPLDRRRELLLA